MRWNLSKLKQAVLPMIALPLSAMAVYYAWSPATAPKQSPVPSQTIAATTAVTSVSPAMQSSAAQLPAAQSSATQLQVAQPPATQPPSMKLPTLQPPTVLKPVNGSVIGISDRTLRWSPTDSADAYQVVILDTIRWKTVFSRKVTNDAQITLDNGVFLFGGKYSASISSLADGNESEPGHIDFSVQTQEAPRITAPEDNSDLRVSDIPVTWTAVEGAEGYKVVVTDTATWKIRFSKTVQNATRLVLDKSLFTIGGKYRIYVAVTINQNDSAPSHIDISTLKLSSPMITSPVDGDILSCSDVPLQWDPVILAEKYRLTLTDRADGSLLYSEDGFADGKAVIKRSLLMPGKDYRIFIHSFLGGNSSDPGWIDFHTRPLASPILTAPTNGASIPLTDLQIGWTPVDLADSYMITVTDTDTWKVIHTSKNIRETSKILEKDLFTLGGHYRIYVHSSCGKTDSIPSYVDVSMPPLLAPAILEPLNAEILPLSDITLGWNPAGNADGYHVTVTDTITWDILYSRDDVADSRMTLSRDLFVPGGKYRIYVASKVGSVESAPNFIDMAIETETGMAP